MILITKLVIFITNDRDLHHGDFDGSRGYTFMLLGWCFGGDSLAYGVLSRLMFHPLAFFMFHEVYLMNHSLGIYLVTMISSSNCYPHHGFSLVYCP